MLHTNIHRKHTEERMNMMIRNPKKKKEQRKAQRFIDKFFKQCSDCRCRKKKIVKTKTR